MLTGRMESLAKGWRRVRDLSAERNRIQARRQKSPPRCNSRAETRRRSLQPSRSVFPRMRRGRHQKPKPGNRAAWQRTGRRNPKKRANKTIVRGSFVGGSFVRRHGTVRRPPRTRSWSWRGATAGSSLSELRPWSSRSPSAPIRPRRSPWLRRGFPTYDVTDR